VILQQTTKVAAFPLKFGETNSVKTSSDYCKPELRELGDIKDLTHSEGSTLVDVTW
jgi:hypothetical protein